MNIVRLSLLGSVLAVSASGQSPSLTSAHTEYIRAGDRILATVSTPAQVYNSSLEPIWATAPYPAFLDAANFMKAKGMTTGCSTYPNPEQFCPDMSLWRYSMAVFVIRAWSMRLWGDPEAFATKSPYSPAAYFTDVPNDSSHTYFPYVQKMYELGLTSGCNTNPLMFCPTTNATNRDIAVFSVRGRNAAEKQCLGPSNLSGQSCAQTLPASYQTTAYNWADVPPTDSYNYQWAEMAALFGAVSPSVASPNCALGSFCPAISAARGQMAAYVLRVVLGDLSF